MHLTIQSSNSTINHIAKSRKEKKSRKRKKPQALTACRTGKHTEGSPTAPVESHAIQDVLRDKTGRNGPQNEAEQEQGRTEEGHMILLYKPQIRSSTVLENRTAANGKALKGSKCLGGGELETWLQSCCSCKRSRFSSQHPQGT